MEKDKAVKTGVLKFKDLDDPLVAMSFRAAVKADNMAIVLWEIVHNLRFRVFPSSNSPCVIITIQEIGLMILFPVYLSC